MEFTNAFGTFTVSETDGLFFVSSPRVRKGTGPIAQFHGHFERLRNGKIGIAYKAVPLSLRTSSGKPLPTNTHNLIVGCVMYDLNELLK